MGWHQVRKAYLAVLQSPLMRVRASQLLTDGSMIGTANRKQNYPSVRACGVLGLLLSAMALLVTSPAPGFGQELVVSAASSLTNAFRGMGGAFEAAHAGTKVVFNFAASDMLLRQIVEGAPVDLFASADQEAMDAASKEGAISPATRINFAANRLVVALPSDSRQPVRSLADLESIAVKRIAIGQPRTVPAGRYAKAALEAVKSWDALHRKFIYTQNVRQSLDYIARGEVDAGFVYGTDVRVMSEKVKIAFDVPTPQRILYPIAVTRRSAQPKLAREFIAFLQSKAGQRILEDSGFAQP